MSLAFLSPLPAPAHDIWVHAALDRLHSLGNFPVLHHAPLATQGANMWRAENQRKALAEQQRGIEEREPAAHTPLQNGVHDHEDCVSSQTQLGPEGDGLNHVSAGADMLEKK